MVKNFEVFVDRNFLKKFRSRSKKNTVTYVSAKFSYKSSTGPSEGSEAAPLTMLQEHLAVETAHAIQ